MEIAGISFIAVLAVERKADRGFRIDRGDFPFP